MNTIIDSGDLPERFAPDTVDDEIARYLSTEPQPTASADDARLIHEIAAYHALPPETDASLARVRARLRASSQVPNGSNSSRHGDSMRETTNGDTRAQQDAHPQPPQQSQSSAPLSPRMRRLTLVPAPLRAIAAVLVVALLVGAFVAVFHLPGGRQTLTASTWQNVAITRANTQGHTLDFDPARVQVEYAVSDVDGAIYANGGSHLWYSIDGGVTYRPFTPALPPDKSELHYVISTVPGLRGVFASPGSEPGPFSTIYYAEPGSTSWRTLYTSTAAQPITLAENKVTLDATSIGKAIFYEAGYGKSVQARAAGNWLFVLAQRIVPSERGDGSTLIGTPDFGTTWYALSTALSGTCTQFTASPADVRQLFCLMSSFTVEQTTDGGLTWKQMTNANGDETGMSFSTSIWASPRAVYSYISTLGTNKKTLAQHPLGAGNWSAAATLPYLPQGGGTEIIGVSPDDTVYAVAAVRGPQTRVQVSALAPGARQFAPVGNEATLTLPNSAIFFDMGGLYSGRTPAVYAHVTPVDQVAGPLPLYRLTLSAENTFPQPVATPFLTPTSLPTATPTMHGACTSTPGDVANIQSGGYGADIDTFAQRWGPSDGVAAGSEYFGQWADGTPKMQIADAMPSNHRVYQMSYIVDKAQDLTQAQGEALAATILPKDATPIARTQQGNEVIVTYCSAALIAAFPASVREVNGPLPHNGWVIVTYVLRNDGNVSNIGFGPQP